MAQREGRRRASEGPDAVAGQVRSRVLLAVADIEERFGISRSAAYRLGRVIPSHRLPGVGLRFRVEDVEAFEERHRKDPANATKPARRRSAGMQVAHGEKDAPAPDDQLAELLNRAGLSLKGD